MRKLHEMNTNKKEINLNRTTNGSNYGRNELSRCNPMIKSIELETQSKDNQEKSNQMEIPLNQSQLVSQITTGPFDGLISGEAVRTASISNMNPLNFMGVSPPMVSSSRVFQPLKFT